MYVISTKTKNKTVKKLNHVWGMPRLPAQKNQKLEMTSKQKKNYLNSWKELKQCS